MKLYHPSDPIIEKPVFNTDKIYTAHCFGFYCTDSLEMTKEWAVAADKNGYEMFMLLILQNFLF